jgi:GT2 family glycosyltransferase
VHEALRSRDHEIIVVDNGSTDGSLDWLKGRPDVITVVSGRNLGFGAGNNLGAAHASGAMLLFINNDTLVQSDLEPLLALAARPEVGMAACRLQYGDGRLQPSIGLPHHPLRIVLSWLGLASVRSAPSLFRRCEVAPACYDGTRSGLAWVSGACFAMRSQVWREVGGFDPAYFMYGEDADLGRSVRQHGFDVAYTSACTVTHYEGAGRPWIGPRALRDTTISYLVYVRKWHGRLGLVWFRPALALVFVLRSAALAASAAIPGPHRAMQREKAAAYGSCAGLLLRVAPPLTPAR